MHNSILCKKNKTDCERKVISREDVELLCLDIDQFEI
jgi:hypothetical protein